MNKFEFIAQQKKKEKKKEDKYELRCPTTVILAFDPNLSKTEVFKDKISTIIWCCVANQHLKDQYFDDNVKYLAQLIKKKKPSTYKAFKEIVLSTEMRQYGLESSRGFFGSNLSDKFCTGVWGYVRQELYKNDPQTYLFPIQQKKLEIKIEIKKDYEYSKT
jgi:hypothetical protein